MKVVQRHTQEKLTMENIMSFPFLKLSLKIFLKFRIIKREYKVSTRYYGPQSLLIFSSFFSWFLCHLFVEENETVALLARIRGRGAGSKVWLGDNGSHGFLGLFLWRLESGLLYENNCLYFSITNTDLSIFRGGKLL